MPNSQETLTPGTRQQRGAGRSAAFRAAPEYLPACGHGTKAFAPPFGRLACAIEPRRLPDCAESFTFVLLGTPTNPRPTGCSCPNRTP